MMLRHFADADGQLWFWRRDFPEGDVRKTTTQNLFVEKDLYTHFGADGSKDVALELFFADLEGAGASFIQQLSAIVRGDDVPQIDDAGWYFWDHFFYYLQKRTPGAIAAIAERMGFAKRIQETADRIRAVRAERGEATDQDDLEEWVGKNAIVVAQAQRPGSDLLKMLSTLGLAIYRAIDPRTSFVVTDVPGATTKFRVAGDWSNPTMFVPLTHDIAVGHLTGGRNVEVIGVDRDQVRRMNAASAARSTIIAGRSEALVASLSRHVPFEGVTLLDQ